MFFKNIITINTTYEGIRRGNTSQWPMERFKSLVNLNPIKNLFQSITNKRNNLNTFLFKIYDILDLKIIVIFLYILIKQDGREFYSF